MLPTKTKTKRSTTLDSACGDTNVRAMPAADEKKCVRADEAKQVDTNEGTQPVVPYALKLVRVCPSRRPRRAPWRARERGDAAWCTKDSAHAA